MRKFILASASSRRQGLLQKLGVPFTAVESNLDEQAEVDNDHSPYEWVKAVSEKKGRKALDKINISEPSVIISADTVVTDMGTILHRPRTKDEARAMMKSIQGRKHTVYTGVSLLFVDAGGNIEDSDSFVDATEVSMNEISDDEIEAYISTDEPYDKAGGYAIQDRGGMFIDYINGDFYTVVGLPLSRLHTCLRKHGINIMELW